jgi:hypothetical protein
VRPLAQLLHATRQTFNLEGRERSFGLGDRLYPIYLLGLTCTWDETLLHRLWRNFHQSGCLNGPIAELCRIC